MKKLKKHFKSLDFKLIAFFCLFFISLPFIFANSKKYSNQFINKSIHREMVFMDVALRNLGSALSLNYKNEIKKSFTVLSSLQTLDMPRYQKGMKRWVRILKNQKNWKYISQLQQKAKKGLALMNQKNINREKIYQNYISIIQSCYNCHKKLGVE